ncbi:MAG: hypothetical protein R3C01_17445, partial [Planctomycetaceae bacterium]
QYSHAKKNLNPEKGALSEYVNVMIYDAEAETPALPPTAPAEMSPTEPASLPMVRDFKPIGPMTGNNEGSRRETGPALDIPTTFTDANVGTDSLDFSDPLPLRPEAPSPGDELSAEATSAEEIEWEPLDRSARRSLEPVPGPPEEVPSSNLFDDPL